MRRLVCGKAIEAGKLRWRWKRGELTAHLVCLRSNHDTSNHNETHDEQLEPLR